MFFRVDTIIVSFQRLERSLEPPRTCDFAHKPENAVKNRFSNAVPFDHCRIVLSIVVGSVNDTTYINASLVKVWCSFVKDFFKHLAKSLIFLFAVASGGLTNTQAS